MPADWISELVDFDSRHLWHPYSPSPAAMPSLAVVGAEGRELILADGRRLIDGMASWWCAVHGYRNGALDGALAAQAGQFAHVMFGGLTHAPAVQLAEELLAIAPQGMDRVFFCDSGSVAVEVAIKMALQAMRGRGEPQRRRLLSVRGGYHGDTFGAMSLCDPVDGMHSLFRGTVAEQLFLPRPPDGFEAELDAAWAGAVEAAFAGAGEDIAAVIVEPVVQGAGGMRFHSPACVRLLRELCDRHGALLILDEIATGFGRTGSLFACEHAGIAPDVMCVGKALTGGYISLAATICTAEVADQISGCEPGALMHGPTYMANALACAVGLASLGILAEGHWREQVAAIEQGFRIGLEPAGSLPGVADVRVLGAIGVIQCSDAVDVAAASAAAIEQGVWLRPFRDLIYAMPAYSITAGELAQLCAAMVASAQA